MKQLFILFTCFLLSNSLHAQKLNGLWYSSDSTRVYEIKQTAENKYIAVIRSSSRKKDSLGYIVIKDLEYNTRRKRYEGVIYAVEDGEPVFVKIKFSKTNTNKINLKLSRMLVFDVSINWVRVNA